MLKTSIPIQEQVLKQANQNLIKCKVRAPKIEDEKGVVYKGRIESRKATNGQYVLAGAQLAVVVDPRLPRLKFTVSEREVPFVTLSSSVNFKVGAYPDRVFKATVFRVGDLADSKSRLVTCYAKLDPESTKDAVLKHGFFTSVIIQAVQKKEAVVVPMIAVLPSEIGFIAYVAENGIAKKRKVKTGLQVSDTEIELIEGIKPGETLIIEGASALSDNSKIVEAPIPGENRKVRPEIAREDPPKP